MENSIEVFTQAQNHHSPSLEEYVFIQPILYFYLFPKYRYQTPPAGMSSPPTKVLSRTDHDNCSSEREILASNMQEVINEINSKRKRDTTLIVGEYFTGCSIMYKANIFSYT